MFLLFSPLRNSPFKIKVQPGDVGDASKVLVSGSGLREGRTHEDNRFHVDTRKAGYGGLSLSVEGPSKAEIKCNDHEDGALDVSYRCVKERPGQGGNRI